MSDKPNSVTVSTSADYPIGGDYERILDYFKQAQKECPKGVGFKKDSKTKVSYIKKIYTLIAVRYSLANIK